MPEALPETKPAIILEDRLQRCTLSAASWTCYFWSVSHESLNKFTLSCEAAGTSFIRFIRRIETLYRTLHSANTCDRPTQAVVHLIAQKQVYNHLGLAIGPIQTWVCLYAKMNITNDRFEGLRSKDAEFVRTLNSPNGTRSQWQFDAV